MNNFISFKTSSQNIRLCRTVITNLFYTFISKILQNFIKFCVKTVKVYSINLFMTMPFFVI